MPAASKVVGCPGKGVVAVVAAADIQLEVAAVACTLVMVDIVGTVDTAVVVGNLVAVEQEANVPAILPGAAVEEDILDMPVALVEGVEMQGGTGIVEAHVDGHLMSWAYLSSTSSSDEVLSALSMVDCFRCRPIFSLRMWAPERGCVTNLSAPKARTPSGALSRGPPL